MHTMHATPIFVANIQEQQQRGATIPRAPPASAPTVPNRVWVAFAILNIPRGTASSPRKYSVAGCCCKDVVR